LADIKEEKSFFDDAAKNMDNKQLEGVKKLYDYLKGKADVISWGTGSITGSFSPKFARISKRSLFTVWSNGELSLNFGWLNDNKSTIKYRDEFKKDLEKKGVFSIQRNYQTLYPEYQINLWSNKVDDFIEVVNKLIK